MKIIFESKEFHSYSLDLQRKLAEQTKNENLVKEILTSSNQKVLASLSKNPILLKVDLQTLSEVGDSRVQKNVAKHANTSCTTLNMLAKKGNTTVKIEVARNPNTNSDTLEELSNQGDSRILLEIYHHKATNKKTLMKVNDKLRYNYRLMGKQWDEK